MGRWAGMCEASPDAKKASCNLSLLCGRRVFSICSFSLSTFALDYCEWIWLPRPIGVGLLARKRAGQWDVGRSDSAPLTAQVLRGNMCFCSTFSHICNNHEKTMPRVIPRSCMGGRWRKPETMGSLTPGPSGWPAATWWIERWSIIIVCFTNVL